MRSDVKLDLFTCLRKVEGSGEGMDLPIPGQCPVSPLLVKDKDTETIFSHESGLSD